MSAADKARHYRLGHGGKRGIERKETTNDKTPRLTCDICSVSFVTQWRLRQHKDDADHKNWKGGPKKIQIELVQISFSFYFVFTSSI